MRKKETKKHLTKRMYVYLAFVTMAAVSLFSKPIQKGFGVLKKHLSHASSKANLRRDLELSARQPSQRDLPVSSSRKSKKRL